MHAITERSPLPLFVGPRLVTTGDTPVPGTERGRWPVVAYVVITPAGELVTRAVDGDVVVDEWGSPYQEVLWAAVHGEVDPHRGEVNGVGLAQGLRAKVADAAMGERGAGADPALYPPNPVASAVLTSLGHPPRRWFGTIAIVAAEDDEGVTASLTAEQLDLLARAHRLAVGG